MEQKHCPACNREGLSVFVEIEDLPVHSNVLFPSREAALNTPKGDIRLGFCKACGMIYNLAFDPNRMKYTEAYENSLHYSLNFQAYAKELATRLIEEYHLHGKDIIEIGCGDREFLSMLCEGGGNRGFGFDPSYDGSRQSNKGAENITFIRDFYSEAYAEYTGDLICCRQVLEHMQYPRDFLLQLHRAIGDRRDTVVFFEVPNVLYTLRDLGIWDIIYEHCSYYSAPSLTRIFQETGFSMLQVGPAFGGQFLCLEAFPAMPACYAGNGSADDLGQLSSFVSTFRENYRNKVKTWNKNLIRLLEEGNRIVVWGGWFQRRHVSQHREGLRSD